MPLSRLTLNRTLHHKLTNAQSDIRSPAEVLGEYEKSNASIKPFTAVADRYLALSEFEDEVVRPAKSGIGLSVHQEQRCVQLGRVIKAYISKAGDALDGYPDLKSGMLLNLVELWVALDKEAVACYSLLSDYHSGFDPSILDTLQLRSLDEMKRLKDVQFYLSGRCKGSSGNGSKTIFATPGDVSFAVRYYNESADAQDLVKLREKIEGAAKRARRAKETEWTQLSDRHRDLMRQVAESSCENTTYVTEHGETVQEHKRGCHKHKLKWQARQIKIQIYEHPLPAFEPAAKAAVFELLCPKAFAVYRDATWRILATYAYNRPEPLEDVPMVREYVLLKGYVHHWGDMQVSLGSLAKSHLNSHYAESDFPVTFEEICRPCGLKVDYYDTYSQTWTRRNEEPSLASHCPLMLPRDSPYQCLDLTYGTWPSSNRILATQTKCPPDLNVHEFMAWQGLLVGTHCRWPSLLRELGSTNLNFSTESTWIVVSRLIHQVGPASALVPLRDVHAVFEDESFCTKLLEQVRLRLEAIRRNWRETVQMDILISILHKVFSLAPTVDVRTAAIHHLETARIITWDWSTSLESLGHAQHSGPSNFAIWAAVLCKRTFHFLDGTLLDLDAQSLRHLVGASIALQNNLIGQFHALPYNLRNAVLQDLVNSHIARDHLHGAIMANTQVLLSALNDIWPVPTDCMDAPMEMSRIPGTWWIFVTLSSNERAVRRNIHFNIVLGTLLIDGQQLGVLPAEYRRWPIIRVLFGNQTLQVFPSPLPGMSLVINRLMPSSHWVHLGFRDGGLVIRAEQGKTVLELINRAIFTNAEHFDLPFALVHNCYHWLDLATGTLEVRQNDPWKSKAGNWNINVRTQRAMRRSSTLVDPNSELFKTVALNFRFFEYAEHITVYQPQKGHLKVELKRLELDFFITRAGLLQCPQLGAVIVESRFQDPGTWYGLQSKIVIRSVKNRSQRGILIPIGESVYERDGQHVRIIIKNRGEGYMKFTLNDVLGRVECPAEPRLLYTMALWHAYTSHFLPDPLTGRTGLEEALHYLKSGLFQPWTPLHADVVDILIEMAKLSPHREYYPTNLKSMETVHWNPALTTAMQDDRYRKLIEEMCQRLADLSLFAPVPGDRPVPQCPSGNDHLESRALSRIYAYSSTKDELYKTRDDCAQNNGRSNVVATAQVLCNWPKKIVTTTNLASLIHEYPIIGGYLREFDKVQLTDLLTIDLGLDWGALAQTSLNSQFQDRYRLMFLFCPMVFSSDSNMELIRVLMAYALLPELKALVPPKHPSYLSFEADERPQESQLVELMKDAKVPFVSQERVSDAQRGQLVLARLDHEKEANRYCQELAGSIRSQWPSQELDVEGLVNVAKAYLDFDEALELVLPEWTRLTRNFELCTYLRKIQSVLDRHCPKTPGQGEFHADFGTNIASNKPLTRPEKYQMRLRGGETPSLPDLLQGAVEYDLSVTTNTRIQRPTRADGLSGVLSSFPNGLSHASGRGLAQVLKNVEKTGATAHIRELEAIVSAFRHSSSSVQRRYGMELEQSIQALLKNTSEHNMAQEPFNPTTFAHQLLAAKDAYRKVLMHICALLQREDPRATWLQYAGLWPKMTPVTLLTHLRSTSGVSFGRGTKEALVRLGLAITAFQRLLRIEDAVQKNRHQQLIDERANLGHENWSALEHTDWLLLEIDGNILLRREQINVAKATIAPASGRNSVLQLLMGKGKTSCILPMVALVLADKQHLFRIVVPRPLLLQSAQVLQSKIGGLLNRDVLHIPFSRRTSTDLPVMKTYCRLHSELRSRSGVMLALPEHILSFKLSGIQRLCDGRVEEASTMIKAQAWLDTHSRDVMDECDVSLAIRTQLIYPSGSQMTVDGHPLRWQCTQAVLRLIWFYLSGLQHNFPQSIEVVKRPRGGFPLIYFLRTDAENHLIAQIVEAICTGQTSIIPCAEFSEVEQMDIRTFISSVKVPVEVIRKVTDMFKEKSHLLKVVYHLRGLFVHRILLSTLKKRWNVQFGLHPDRDPIAVPYSAKGVPSPSSEWGHPDVAIILTCLSFYYEGLNIAQFKQAFEQLLKADEPSIEYEKWATKDLPEGLRDYNAINVEDSTQLRELHGHICYNVCLLDFYLNSFVFPRHAKQFKTKLQASGWDLILYDPTRSSQSLTTGFSGTNDSRHQLPLTIRQNDLPELAHTNAEVLSYLLADRNRLYVLAVDHVGKRLSEEGLLQRLFNPLGVRHDRVNIEHSIRVLIDAGAQILEHDNESLVREWLKIDTHAVAAVFFASDHKPWAIYRTGRKLPLVASPFAENLEDCLVYLDESHCRGTDLKLPAEARAALTLGPHLTKDALAQAAMRLRLLGQSQSVIFFSPPEVHQSILDLRQAGRAYQPDSSDVIRWLLEQTCNGIEQLEPLYFTQGNSYLQRLQAKLNFPDFLGHGDQRKGFLSVMQAKELHTLKQLYEPKLLQRGMDKSPCAMLPCLQGNMTELQQRKKDFQDRGVAIQSSALEEVEQEREIEVERESVREVQNPFQFKALKFPRLHQDIEEFARIGRLPVGSDAYLPMPSALQASALGMKHGAITAATMASGLFISTQFNRTVSTTEPNDNFLRPCHWILWSCSAQMALLVCPEEANLLIPILRNIPYSRLLQKSTHLIVYAAPVTRRMLHFNNLEYYAVPPLPFNFQIPVWLKYQLGIFSGRLYFDWEEYHPIRAYLGIDTVKDSSERQGVYHESFAKKPLTFLHDWLAVRRKGQDFEHTPMGFITTGKPLSSDHPFFFIANSEKELNTKVNASSATPRKYDDTDCESDDDHEEDDFYDAEDGYDGEEYGRDGDVDEFDEANNTFLQGGAYVEERDDME